MESQAEISGPGFNDPEQGEGREGAGRGPTALAGCPRVDGRCHTEPLFYQIEAGLLL